MLPKKFLIVMFIVLSMFGLMSEANANSSAERFISGVHYTEFTELEPSTQPRLMEFVSVFCPGCYSTEANRGIWSHGLPSNLQTAKVHVDFMPGTSREGFEAINRAIAIHNRHQQNIGNQIVWELFTMVHERNIRLTPERIKMVISVASSRAGSELIDEYDSFAVRSMANNSQRLQRQMRDIGVVRGVPTFLVNNRYRINLDKLDRENYFSELNAIITYLSTKDFN